MGIIFFSEFRSSKFVISFINVIFKISTIERAISQIAQIASVYLE